MAAARSLIASLALVPASSPAATVVDWWTLDPADNTRLLDDAEQSAAVVTIVPTVGTAFPMFPLSGEYHHNYWLTPHEMTDSVTLDLSLPTFDVLVLPPPEGGFHYTLVVEGPSLANAVFAVGGLYPIGNPRIVLTARDAGGGEIPGTLFLSQHGWDAGFTPYDGGVDWDDLTKTLSLAGDTGNESAFAFFRLPASGVTRLEIEVESLLFPAPGESISFAIGRIVPEPSWALLSILGFAVSVFRRKR